MKLSIGRNRGQVFTIIWLALASAFWVTGRAQTPNAMVIVWGGSSYLSTSTNTLSLTNPVAVAAGEYHTLALQGDGTVVVCGNNLINQTNVPPDVTNVVSLAAGLYFNMALRSDRTVVAWGNNTYGQTNVPATATNVVRIAARNRHALALRADGTVVAWGDNDYGQTNVPAGLTDVIAIAAGHYHDLALRSDQTVVAWGSQYLVPVAATNVIALAAGFEHSLALRSDGQILAWGDNASGQCNVPVGINDAVAIAAGNGFSAALLSDGRAVVWGRNADFLTNASSAGFVRATNVPVGLSNVVSIACGADHIAALTRSGAPQVEVQSPPTTVRVGTAPILTANGGGSYPITYQWQRDAIPIPGGTNRWLQINNAQLADSGDYTLVVSNEFGQTVSAAVTLDVQATPYFLSPLPPQRNYLPGTLASFSVNAIGLPPLSYQAQLNGFDLTDDGRIAGTATPFVSFNPVTYNDSGLLSMVVANNQGAYTGLVALVAITPVVSWGDNSVGQCLVPATVTNVIAIVSGADHNLALRADGTVAAWGENRWGQNNVPPTLGNVVAVAAGETHSLALRADGTVVAWGNNVNGQTNVPATVQNAVAIAAGSTFSQALLANGSIIQWGLASTLPAGPFVMMATRGANSLAVRSGVGIVQWGSYPAGIPSSITAGTTNIVAVGAGLANSMVLRNDGSVVAWGNNSYGLTNIPVAATNIVSIAAGEEHFLALRTDGVVIAWGNPKFSQAQVPALTQSLGAISAGSVHSLAVLGPPFHRTATEGEPVTFTAGTLARRLATYQWQFNGVNMDGATNATLTLGNVAMGNAGSYRVRVAYTVGAVTSPVMTLAVTPAFKLEVTGVATLPANGVVHLRITGASGLNPVVVHASTNLVDWILVFTNPPTTTPIEFTDLPPSALSQRFYRAVEQP